MPNNLEKQLPILVQILFMKRLHYRRIFSHFSLLHGHSFPAMKPMLPVARAYSYAHTRNLKSLDSFPRPCLAFFCLQYVLPATGSWVGYLEFGLPGDVNRWCLLPLTHPSFSCSCPLPHTLSLSLSFSNTVPHSFPPSLSLSSPLPIPPLPSLHTWIYKQV